MTVARSSHIPHPLSILKLFSYPHSVQLKRTSFGPHPEPLLSERTIDSFWHFGQIPWVIADSCAFLSLR